jgi:selenocysteine lyase/cysteine desulfurase
MRANRNNFFLAHYDKHYSALQELKKFKSIRELLSENLGLPNNFYFSHNTTSSLICILRVLLCNSTNDFYLAFSNLEHPTIRKIIESLWSKEKLICLNLYPYLMKGDFDSIENEISVKTQNKRCIHIISHVLWNIGAKLNIESISAKIKKKNPKDLIIIDGAQAVGNLPNPIFNLEKYNHIDFYIGCTHKWIGTENTLGFVSIHPKYIKSTLYLQIMLSDLFSSYAGPISQHEEFDNSTYNLLYLLAITKELNQVFIKHLNSSKFNISTINTQKKISSIPVCSERLTSYSAVYGEYDEIIKFCRKNSLNNTFIAFDENLPENNFWVRLGKYKS